MLKIYGIKNCDSMKKAFNKLEEKSLEYEFIDYKKNIPSNDKITEWFDKSSMDKVINKRSTSWKSVEETEKEKINSGDVQQAVKTIQNKPTLAKRPIVENNGKVYVGLDELNEAV